MARQRQQEEERKDMAEREYLILERLRLDEEEAVEKVERREKTKRSKESKRYILPKLSCYEFVHYKHKYIKRLGWEV